MYCLGGKINQIQTIVVWYNCKLTSFVLRTSFNYIFRSLNFVYPFGATLNVVKPAVPVLSSGTVSLPVNRPVCAFYTSKVTI